MTEEVLCVARDALWASFEFGAITSRICKICLVFMAETRAETISQQISLLYFREN